MRAILQIAAIAFICIFAIAATARQQRPLTHKELQKLYFAQKRDSLFMGMQFAENVEEKSSNTHIIPNEPIAADMGNRKISPIIFVPGIGGSGLEAKLKNVQKPPLFSCEKNSNWYRIWVNGLQFVPKVSLECFFRNMQPYFNASTGFINSAQGVTLRGVDVGGVNGVRYLSDNFYFKEKTAYVDYLIKYLEPRGYVIGKSIRAIPFDFRLGPFDWMSATENNFFAQLKALVEDTYAINENTKVSLIGHSFGAPVVTLFLSQYVEQPWKDKYIESFVSLAGAYGGSSLAALSITVGTNYGISFLKSSDMKNIITNMASVYWLMPVPEIVGSKTVQIITPTKNYSMSNFEELLTDAGISYAIPMYRLANQYNKTAAPGVKTYCLYSYGNYTLEQFKLPNVTNPSEKDVVPTGLDANGDSVVTSYNLQVCDTFASTQKEPVYVKRFLHGGHFMLSVTSVLEAIYDATSGQSSRGEEKKF